MLVDVRFDGIQSGLLRFRTAPITIRVRRGDAESLLSSALCDAFIAHPNAVVLFKFSDRRQALNGTRLAQSTFSIQLSGHFGFYGHSFIICSFWKLITAEFMRIKITVVALVALGLSGCASNKILPADEEWRAGKPWPSHWGMPYDNGGLGWNIVQPLFVHKDSYSKEEVAKTRLKDVPSAMEENAVVEICRFKKGLFQLATVCSPALVVPELRGKLHKDDVVAVFMEARDVAANSAVPVSPDYRMANRVFQKLADEGDDDCWQRTFGIIKSPNTQNCMNRIDKKLTEHMLERDFGPRR